LCQPAILATDSPDALQLPASYVTVNMSALTNRRGAIVPGSHQDYYSHVFAYSNTIEYNSNTRNEGAPNSHLILSMHKTSAPHAIFLAIAFVARNIHVFLHISQISTAGYISYR